MKQQIKKFYKALPLKKELFQAIKLFWTPPHSVYKHLYFKGIFKVRVDKHHSFRIRHHGTEIENDIFWKGLTGGWEKLSMQLWIQLCKKANVVLDIGANTGIYALTAKAVNKDARVFAFEPLYRVVQKLKLNNEINGYNIVCVEKALSNQTGKAIIYENDSEHIAAASLNAETRAYGPIDKETEIETITLDDFITQQGITGVDLIKIDVETHEPQVMEGFRKHLSLFRPSFLIEVLGDEVGAKCQAVLEGLGYLYFNIDDRNEKIRRVDRIIKSDYFNYLICTEETARSLSLV